MLYYIDLCCCNRRSQSSSIEQQLRHATWGVYRTLVFLTTGTQVKRNTLTNSSTLADDS